MIKLSERLYQLWYQADLFVSLSGCSRKRILPRFGSTSWKADLT
jgi:hypothetical protein